jgi:hypothetical protein
MLTILGFLESRLPHSTVLGMEEITELPEIIELAELIEAGIDPGGLDPLILVIFEGAITTEPPS